MSAQISQAIDESKVAESHDIYIHAVLLARKGQYEAAILAVQTALVAEQCSAAQAADLQARIYSQQGLYLRAESCWEEAKAHDKENPDFDRALARLRQPRASASALRLGASMAAIVAFGMLAWQLVVVNPKIENSISENSLAYFEAQKAIAEGQLKVQTTSSEAVQTINYSVQQLVALNKSLADSHRALDARITNLDQRMGEKLASIADEDQLGQYFIDAVSQLTESIDLVRQLSERNFTAIEFRQSVYSGSQNSRLETLKVASDQLSQQLLEFQTFLQARDADNKTTLSERFSVIENLLHNKNESSQVFAKLDAVEVRLEEVASQLVELSYTIRELQQNSQPNTPRLKGEDV